MNSVPNVIKLAENTYSINIWHIEYNISPMTILQILMNAYDLLSTMITIDKLHR